MAKSFQDLFRRDDVNLASGTCFRLAWTARDTPEALSSNSEIGLYQIAFAMEAEDDKPVSVYGISAAASKKLPAEFSYPIIEVSLDLQGIVNNSLTVSIISVSLDQPADTPWIIQFAGSPQLHQWRQFRPTLVTEQRIITAASSLALKRRPCDLFF